jgi:hypothetical protein
MPHSDVRAFYDTDPGLEGQYSEWIAKFPSSYSAYLARGIYYRYLGLQARGNGFISDTSREQLAVMSMYTDKAMQDYDRSSTLIEKPLISYHAVLAIAMLFGDDALS